MPQFYTLLTDVGQAKLANAVALGQTIEITELAVGDGSGNLPTPDSSATALVNEVRRAPINASQTDPNNPSWIVVEQVLPPDVGGWTIREIGIYDVDGDLIGIGNYPETYKPVLAEGSSRTQTVRFVLEVSDTSAVTLKVDPSVVLATREYVDAERAEHEAGRAHPLATDTERGMVIKATQAEVNAGTDDGKFITSAKLKAWATQWVKAATETVAGMLKIATQAEAEEGEDDTKAMTAKKVLAAFNAFEKQVGVAQSWQDVTASRAIGVTYTNTTGRPIVVHAFVYGTGSTTYATVQVDDGLAMRGSYITSSQYASSVSVIVPNESTYKLIDGSALAGCWELR